VLTSQKYCHFNQIFERFCFLYVFRSIDKSKALSLVLHCCDISHPAKRWTEHHQWTSLLLEEFFLQGERESDLGLPFSPLCDRKNTLVAESQIGKPTLTKFNLSTLALSGVVQFEFTTTHSGKGWRDSINSVANKTK